jgi:hypothetical protein
MNKIAEINTNQQILPIQMLADDEIELIGGGNPALVWIGVTAAFGALNAAEGFGEKIGKALYYALH